MNGSNIFKTGELEEDSVSSKMETTATDGKSYLTMSYNLDAVITVGDRVNSVQDILLPKLMTGEVLVKLDQGNLFGKERSVITKHIKNIFGSSELDEKSNVQKMHFTHFDKEKKLDELATAEDFSVVHFDKEMQRISGIRDDKK